MLETLDKIKVDKFTESFDLSLLVLQSFDLYSYNRFLEELQKKSNRLIFIVFNLRLQNQIKLINDNYKKDIILKFLVNQIIFKNDIMEILIIFSNILNSKFCQQKLDLICLYFLPESSFFATKLKNKNIKTINFFNFWVINNKKRFNFFFIKLFPLLYPYKIYDYLTILYLQNGLSYLKFYRKI
jgi:hypothetical protein